jgi:ribonuclease HI
VFGLLHPDFLEFGASGSVWDAEAIVSQLADELAGERVKTRDESPTQLADDVILLTYAVVHPTAPSLRSSVWIRVDEEWRLRFHQGTRAAAPASR